jgi:iron-sulfur cluster assembly protein
MNPAISATPKAIEHIQKMLKKRGSGIGMRLSIKNSGCSGKKYIVSLIDEINPEDHIYELAQNIKIYVDANSFVYVAGTVIDYVKKGLNENFVFHNPNEKASCGCGESFYV